MIVTTRRHGRTRRDIRNLIAHLNKQTGQTSRVVTIGNVPLANTDDAMAYMETLRDASRATVSCHHISISPRNTLTDTQRDEAVRRILRAMDAEDHAFVVWQHSEKPRADADVADDHFHVVVSHIGPDGRALSDRRSFVRMEAAARAMEADFGEALTHSRKTKSVIAELRRMGRDDVADMLIAPATPPKSAMSSQTRARAEREGWDLPKAQATVRAAWISSDSATAFWSAIQTEGFELVPGKKPGVFVVMKSGAEIGALDRIVRERRAVVAARLKQEDRNDRQDKETTLSRRSHLHGSAGGQDDIRATPAASGATPGGRDRDRRPARRIEGSSDRDPRRIEIPDQNSRTARRRLRDRAAIAAIQRLDLDELTFVARGVAAGGGSIHDDRGSIWGRNTMPKDSDDLKRIGIKRKLLIEAAPRGFDAEPFVSDLRMIQVPSPLQPTTKILLNDGGWVEIDRQARIVRFWGKPGRARILAAALADAGGWDVEELKHTVTVARKASALRVGHKIDGRETDLVAWWQERGYVATAAPDGTWVHVGAARIRDMGDLMEVHGPVSGDVAVAIITKARDAWDGGVYLYGHWTQVEKDMIWLEAQRQGVVVENCEPSSVARDVWRKEQERSVRRVETMGKVRSVVQDAADLLAGARGNHEALQRLPDDLRAFVMSYLDDDQRTELAMSDVATVIPELTRFRKLGEAELAEMKRSGRPQPAIRVPEPKPEPDDPLAPTPA
jgi:hypothetical protein